MKISFAETLICIDRYSSYVPVFSTVTNLVDLIAKGVLSLRPKWGSQNRYCSYLRSKSITRCVLLALPLVINNIACAVWDRLFYKSQSTPLISTEDFEETKNGFWKLLQTNQVLDYYTQKILQLSDEPPKVKAELIIDEYLAQKRKSDPRFFLSKEATTALLNDIESVMTRSSEEEATSSVRGLHATNISLKIFPTKGDGSCGIHAVLGELKNGVYQVSDPSAVRKNISETLSTCKAEGDLPSRVISVLQDFFTNFETHKYVIPKKFYTSVIAIYKEYKKQYDFVVDLERKAKGSNATQKDLEDISKAKEKVLTSFCLDDSVFKAYLRYLSTGSEWLREDELSLVGEIYKINVILHKNKSSTTKEIVSINLSEGFSRTVHVWYNGRSHFERAELIPN